MTAAGRWLQHGCAPQPPQRPHLPLKWGVNATGALPLAVAETNPQPRRARHRGWGSVVFRHNSLPGKTESSRELQSAPVAGRGAALSAALQPCPRPASAPIRRDLLLRRPRQYRRARPPHLNKSPPKISSCSLCPCSTRRRQIMGGSHALFAGLMLMGSLLLQGRDGTGRRASLASPTRPPCTPT